ncbi:Carboxylesterase NlhH [Paramyrothecium foliicola]|nr:Carboxylesterase NlhH [Paramyrothecium foliicola]
MSEADEPPPYPDHQRPRSDYVSYPDPYRAFQRGILSGWAFSILVVPDEAAKANMMPNLDSRLWVASLCIVAKGLPALMRTGFHWDERNVVPNEGSILLGPGVGYINPVHKEFKSTRRYFLSDLSEPCQWFENNYKKSTTMQLKTCPQYVDLRADFEPLPKHGHLSSPKNAEYAAIQEFVDAAFAPLWALPSWSAFREAAGDADATIPPGGPDRYRDITTEFLHFKARDGYQVELKVYKSVNVTSNATLMIRMHGGGWVVGGHETDGVENVYAAALHNIVVVSVLYRKAPENPFPYAINDSYDALLWCKENASSLGVDPESIIVGGSSAGANLAAALAIEARNHGISGLVAQVLHFPPVCHPKFSPKAKYEFGSYVQNGDTSVLDAIRMEAFADAYMPNAEPDHRHSPLLASSLENLPPAFIQCAGLDVLRDDALAYGEALQQADVQVELHAYRGLPHCFPGIMPTLAETGEFYNRYNAFLTKYAR